MFQLTKLMNLFTFWSIFLQRTAALPLPDFYEASYVGSNFSGSVTVSPSPNVSNFSGNVTVSPSKNVSNFSGSVTMSPSQNVSNFSGSVTMSPSQNVSIFSGSVTVSPSPNVSNFSGSVTMSPSQSVSSPSFVSGSVTMSPSQSVNNFSGSVTMSPSQSVSSPSFVSGSVTMSPSSKHKRSKKGIGSVSNKDKLKATFSAIISSGKGKSGKGKSGKVKSGNTPTLVAVTSSSNCASTLSYGPCDTRNKDSTNFRIDCVTEKHGRWKQVISDNYGEILTINWNFQYRKTLKDRLDSAVGELVTWTIKESCKKAVVIDGTWWFSREASPGCKISVGDKTPVWGSCENPSFGTCETLWRNGVSTKIEGLSTSLYVYV